MSTRERWIIYPLLFLTLGIVLRDKIVPQGHFQASELAAGRIHCGQLQVDQTIAAGGLTARGIQCGELVITGQNGRPTVVVGTDLKTKGGVVTTWSPAGLPLVLLQPTDAGGVVVASAFLKSTMTPPSTPRKSAMPAPKAPSKEPERPPAKAGK